MRALFDNYEVDATINEYVSPTERKEENEFLNAVLATPVMRTAMKFLQDKGNNCCVLGTHFIMFSIEHFPSKGVVTSDPKTHFDLLKTIWFTMYSRSSGKIGSSGFEHVFLNEIVKNNTIGGLHNWVWFYHKEGQSGIKHSINYQGYMKSQVLGTVSRFYHCTSIRVHFIFNFYLFAERTIRQISVKFWWNSEACVRTAHRFVAWVGTGIVHRLLRSAPDRMPDLTGRHQINDSDVSVQVSRKTPDWRRFHRINLIRNSIL